MFGACLLSLTCVRRVGHGILLATLALFGFCWSLPMRHTVVFHDYESLYHIGMPLVLFALVLSYLRHLFGSRPVYCLSIAALWIFCSSSYQMGRVGHSAGVADFHHAIIADFKTIRDITSGRSVRAATPDDRHREARVRRGRPRVGLLSCRKRHHIPGPARRWRPADRVSHYARPRRARCHDYPGKSLSGSCTPRPLSMRIDQSGLASVLVGGRRKNRDSPLSRPPRVEGMRKAVGVTPGAARRTRRSTGYRVPAYRGRRRRKRLARRSDLSATRPGHRRLRQGPRRSYGSPDAPGLPNPA